MKQQSEETKKHTRTRAHTHDAVATSQCPACTHESGACPMPLINTDAERLDVADMALLRVRLSRRTLLIMPLLIAPSALH